MKLSKICGIYSFPKSGNTWVREIVHSLFVQHPVKDNLVFDLHQKSTFGPMVKAPDQTFWRFYKSHDANEVALNHDGNFENDLIIYIIRNPLDVFLSQLNYLFKYSDVNPTDLEIIYPDIDGSIENGVFDSFFASFLVFGTLMPTFNNASSWMKNTKYWLERAITDPRVVVLRYEYLIDDFIDESQKLTSLFGFTTTDTLQALNSANDRSHDGGKFYWKKSHRNYIDYLKPEQIDLFVRIHHDSIKLSGYLDYFNNQLKGDIK